MALFEQFLVKEFSEENLQFWQACNRYSNSPVNGCDLVMEARAIFKQFLVDGAPKQVHKRNSHDSMSGLHIDQVNIDYQTQLEISENIDQPNHKIFIQAQRCVYNLMSGDSYKRFVQSESFQRALNSVTVETP